MFDPKDNNNYTKPYGEKLRWIDITVIKCKSVIAPNKKEAIKLLNCSRKNCKQLLRNGNLK
jgi:hypothetical protein